MQNIPPIKNCLLILPKPEEKKRKPKSPNSPAFSVYILFLSFFIQIFLRKIDYQHWKPTSVTAVNSHISLHRYTSSFYTLQDFQSLEILAPFATDRKATKRNLWIMGFSQKLFAEQQTNTSSCFCLPSQLVTKAICIRAQIKPRVSQTHSTVPEEHY